MPPVRLGGFTFPSPNIQEDGVETNSCFRLEPGRSLCEVKSGIHFLSTSIREEGEGTQSPWRVEFLSTQVGTGSETDAISFLKREICN